MSPVHTECTHQKFVFNSKVFVEVHVIEGPFVFELSELGVFAKKAIPKRTQFGPFIAELVESQDKVTSSKFLLQVKWHHILSD